MSVSQLCRMTLIGICVASLIFTSVASIQSTTDIDPCLSEHHSIIDDYRRSTKYRPRVSERRLCDNNLTPGWYRLKINGTDADIPNKCVKVKRCGTAAPIWLSMPKKELPVPGATKSGSACVTWSPRGEAPECCSISFPVEVKNCINFFVYKLTSTGGCDLAYCAEVPKKTCSTGQVYIRHLKKCIVYNARTSKPALQVSVSRKNVMITCTFRVLNKLIAMTSPTFYIAWYRKERGNSLIKSTFTRKTKDSIVIGEHAFTGDTIICSVEEIYQLNNKKSKKSRPYFIGIKLLRKKVVLREDRPIANVTLVSTVPIVCDNNANTCDVTINLALQTPDIFPGITFEKCVVRFGMGWKCQRNICQEETILVAMSPNLKHLPKQKLVVRGNITTTNLLSWKQKQVNFKMKAVDFAPASCYILSGLHVISFAGSVERVREAGAFVLLSSEDSPLQIHAQVMKNPHHDMFSLCGLALRFEGVVLSINRCSESTWNKRYTLQYQGQQQNSRMQIFEARQGKLLTIYIHDLVQIRIDINSLDISATVHISGFYSNRVEGLCGTVVRKKNKNAVTAVTNGYGFRVWRVEFHQSLFQLSPASYEGIKTQFPRCQCALNSPSNSCTEDKNRSEFYSFIYQKDITSEFYVNKNKPLIIKSYNISSTSDISDNSVSLSRDARQQCKEVIRESDLFLKCIPLRGRILVDIVSVCEKMAAVQDRSTWIPIVLRLMESVCNFAFTSNTSLSDRNLPSGIDHVTRIKDLFRCPENCFEHGKCTRDGCACFKGYSGVECLDKAVVPTNDGSSQSTETRPVTPTPFDHHIPSRSLETSVISTKRTTAEPRTTSTVPTTTTTPQPTKTPKTTPSSTTTTTTTTSTTTATTTTTTSPTTTTPLPSSATSPRPRHPIFVSCDTRSSGCSFVYLRIQPTQVPVSCRVTNVKFRNKKWIPWQVPLFPTIRYVSPSLAECVLNSSIPIPNDGDPVYKVEVLGARNEVLSDKLFSRVNKRCRSCSYWRGCRVRRNVCVINEECYMNGDQNPTNNCQVCLASSSMNQWSLNEDNLPPVLQREPYQFNVVEGDIINSSVAAYDPEGSRLTFSVNSTDASVQVRDRAFLYRVAAVSLGREERFEYFNISVVDDCNLKSSLVVKVAVRMCNCQNNGTCVKRNITMPNQARAIECSCQHPFTGRLCEEFPDFCASQPCFAGVQCTNMNTSYRCGRCPLGYVGNGAICRPSCSSSPCFENVTCIEDFYGNKGFRCGPCPRFYRGDGIECSKTDSDICKYGVCSKDERCDNMVAYPGYRCSPCPPGYHGDGRNCKAVCKINCQNGGTCVDGSRCQCRPGFDGNMCEREVCSVRCLNGGRCHMGNQCLCPRDYTGYYCQTPVCSPPCQNRGVCVRPGTCYCPSGYYGSFCERATCWTYCQNGGRCEFNSCVCTNGWMGRHCHIPLCWPRCRYGGQCIKPNQCRCRTGYSGQYCQIVTK
uniref:von Willebrand factor D and EGF domain-containing protein-like isoform X4 n=1 Tax=Crassostrea virginica TaxID=6565 RepID=A0A8B8DCT7_CRAVI|nr:von Willebrand factor D and EGF domain-containing protein-like isoform X4 [Crassostrea virginica]